MALNTFQGLMRSTGGQAKETGVSPSPLMMSVVVSFDPTAASATPVRIGTSATAGNTLTLPQGAVPVSLVVITAATGGVSPTVDIGTAASPEGIFNEVPAGTKGQAFGANGALVVGTGLTANSVITGRVGASAATGGPITCVLNYTVYNDGSFDT